MARFSEEKATIDELEQLRVVGKVGARRILGRSLWYFKEHIRYSKKFMQNVPNKTPGAYKPTYLVSDVLRYRKLNDWW